MTCERQNIPRAGIEYQCRAAPCAECGVDLTLKREVDGGYHIGGGAKSGVCREVGSVNNLPIHEAKANTEETDDQPSCDLLNRGRHVKYFPMTGDRRCLISAGMRSSRVMIAPRSE